MNWCSVELERSCWTEVEVSERVKGAGVVRGRENRKERNTRRSDGTLILLAERSGHGGLVMEKRAKGGS